MMTWWLRRTLGGLLLLVLGIVGGLLAGAALQWPRTGALAGAALAVAALLAREVWRGRKLMRWLRGPLSTPAPRDAGYWGEFAYRIERALRARDAAIRAEQDRLSQFLSAIEASPNGVLLVDETDHIVWSNTVAAEHFGLDPVRDLRQRVTNLVRMPAFVAYLQQRRHDEPVVFGGPGGRTTLSVMVRRYGGGMQLVLSQDITERERAEAMRRSFVANVSHEIRTPLTVLAGFVETLATLQLGEGERARVLELMQQQTDRMQALVADLLTLASLEGSPRPAPDRWIGVAGFVAPAQCEAVALSAGRHEIDVEVPEDAEIAGSATELQSAAANLLNNAVRYTPDGGRIVLRWRWQGGGAALEVSDTGIGIPREHIGRLTERFYRVDGSRSRDTGGTGLGLAIVKHVAQRHGGEVEIHSEPGKGSTFRIVFPATRVRRRVAFEAPAPAAAG